jgi:hypothetical protein
MTSRIVGLVAVAVLIAGAVFTLQGLRFLPSRLMYGRPEWVVIGIALVIASLAALAWLAKNRRPAAPSP